MQALNYLHELNIVHRDLKTENMLFSSKKTFVKLIDFGFANFCNGKGGQRMNEVKGTPLYMSPEVLLGEYDKRCDLWSVGVITFYLLSGEHPFNGRDFDELEELITTCDYDFDAPVWKSISKQAKSFITKLIEPDVKRRFTCEQALAHPWITQN